jgi:hypothetical protein
VWSGVASYGEYQDNNDNDGELGKVLWLERANCHGLSKHCFISDGLWESHW